MSVKDYDERLVLIWGKAALQPEGISLPFTDPDPNEALKRAITQRHKMYRLRVEMRKEKHEKADLAFKCKIRIRIGLKSGKVIYFSQRKTWEDKDVDSVTMQIVSNSEDDSMDKALAAAGFEAPEAPSLD